MKKLVIYSLCMTMTGTLAACGGSQPEPETPEEGPMEEAGESVDDTADDVGDEAEEAWDETGDAMEEAGDEADEEM